MRLTGAKVLLTGASRGIGAALAAALRAEGCELHAVARSGGPGIERCDVAKPGDVAALYDRIGPVDLLINNAAVIHHRSRATPPAPRGA